MNGHLAYVTRRIQELLVEDHLRRHGQPAPVAVCGQAAPPCGELSDEAVIEAAIDPYVAIRNGYIQYRMKEVQARRARSLFFRNWKSTATQAADPPPAN